MIGSVLVVQDSRTDKKLHLPNQHRALHTTNAALYPQTPNLAWGLKEALLATCVTRYLTAGTCVTCVTCVPV